MGHGFVTMSGGAVVFLNANEFVRAVNDAG